MGKFILLLLVASYILITMLSPPWCDEPYCADEIVGDR
jgi:hypothetical protein